MNKIITGLIILNLFLGSCHRREKDKLEEILTNYLFALSPFDAKLKTHFPLDLFNDEIKDLSFVTPNSVVNGGYSYAILRIHPDSVDFRKSLTDISNNSYTEVLLDDNTIILPDSGDHSFIEDPIFIPDFREVIETENVDSQEKSFWNYKIYLIDSAKGNYTNSQEELKRKQYLPKNWEHGYSRGIGIDSVNKDVIYWLLIW